MRAIRLPTTLPTTLVTALLTVAALRGWGAAQSALLEPCGASELPAEALSFDAPRGLPIEGVLLGEGDPVVVLSNQSSNRICPWIPLVRELVDRGYRVLLYEYGYLNPPPDELAAAVAALRERGAERILLVGASRGAMTTLVAAAREPPGVTALVTLSAEASLEGEEIAPHAARVTLPVLFVTAERDTYGSHVATPEFHRLAPSSDKELLVVPGSAHGYDLLADPDVVERVLDFLAAHR